MRTPFGNLAAVFVALAVRSLAEAAEPSAASDEASVELTPVYLSELSAEISTNNAALKAAAARARAAGINIQSFHTWADPEFMIGTTAGSVAKRMDDGDLVYGLRQELPLFGRARAERKVARSEAATAEMDAALQLQMTKLELARQLFKTALAEQTLELGRSDLRWLETMTAAAEDRYRANSGGQVELLRMQNERDKRREQIRTDERQRDQEKVQLNRLLNRPDGQPWPRLRVPEAAPLLPWSGRLERLVLANEAKAKVLRLEVARAEAALASSRKDGLPKVSVGAELRQYSGTGEAREGFFSVTMSMPWVNRDSYRSHARRDEAKLEAARLELADYERFTTADTHRLVTMIDSARREALLYRDQIIPRSELGLRTAHAAWSSNKGMFTEMMEARRMLLEAQAMHYKAVAEQYTGLVELVLCCGVADLEALQMLAPSDPTTPTSKP